MTDGIELGVGYVSLNPSADGFTGKANDELRDPLDDVGKESGNRFSQAFIATGAVAIAAGLAAGITGAINREGIIAELSASLGGGEVGQAAGEAAGNLYSRGLGAGLEDVADSVGTVQERLGDLIGAGDLEGATAQALGLARVLDEDVAGVASAAGQLFRNGLAPDIETAFDLLAAGQANGLNRSDDLIDTVNEYSGAFARLGLDGGQALSLIDQGLEAGAFNADKIGDAFNEFSIRAIDGSEGTSSALESLGLSADEVAAQIAAGGPAAAGATAEILDRLRAVDDQVAQDAAGVALFGSIWEDLGSEALLALDPTADALGDVEGAAAAVSDQLGSTFQARIERLKRRGFDALVTAADRFLIPALDGVATGFEFLSRNADIVVPIVTALAIGIAAALVPAFIGWATAAGAAAIATLVALAPLIAIGVAVAAVAAGLIFAYRESETFRDIVNGAFELVGEVVEGVLGFFIDRLGNVVGTLRGVADFVAGVFTGDWDRAWSGIRTIFVNVFDLVLSLPLTILGALRDAVPAVVGAVVSAITGPFEGVPGAIGGFLDDAVGFVTGLPGRVVGALGTLGSRLFGIASAAFDIASVDGFGAGLVAGVGAVVRFVTGIPGRIVDAIGAIGSILFQIGKDVINGFLDGLQAAWGGVSSWLGDRAEDVGNVFKSVLGIRSPSTVFIEIGQNTIDGLQVGIENRQSSLRRTAGNVVGAVASDAANVSPAATVAAPASSGGDIYITQTDPSPETVAAAVRWGIRTSPQ